MADLHIIGAEGPAPPDDASKRLQVLQDLCERIASGIMTARSVLRSNAEDENVPYLVADALDRLGWMADEATVLAGSSKAVVGGDADGWILNGLIGESGIKTNGTYFSVLTDWNARK